MPYSPVVEANSFVVFRLPSGILSVIEVNPDTVISIGKFGAFPSNQLIGRPVYTTYEIIECRIEAENRTDVCLRIVPPSELHAQTIAEETGSSEVSNGQTDVPTPDAAGLGPTDAVADAALTALKNNRLTVDDPLRQKLSTQEIEELKKADTTSGRDIIRRIMEAHTKLGEKTAFSLAKYTLRKTKKYIKRFTVLPLDVGSLTQWLLLDKDPGRIMELREETLGLINAWANVHHGELPPEHEFEGAPSKVGGSRYLVVDETGGLVVASLAERLGILYADSTADEQEEEDDMTTDPAPDPTITVPRKRKHATVELAGQNSIHLIHQNAQPNLSLLKYFGYDTNNPPTTHPLHSHLKPLTWLQFVDPKADSTYNEPPIVNDQTLSTWKSGRRGQYFRKRRRWQRCSAIVDETRRGGFDGLIVASNGSVELGDILQHLVPLVRGGGNVVVFAPAIEPLTRLTDLYSRERKGAFLDMMVATTGIDDDDEDADVVAGRGNVDRDLRTEVNGDGNDAGEVKTPARIKGEEAFGVDPRLLLAPSVYTTRVRPWQALPGRTHPLMAVKGGAEGYVFVGRRVVPVEGRVEARGNFSKKRKVDGTV